MVRLGRVSIVGLLDRFTHLYSHGSGYASKLGDDLYYCAAH